MTNFDPPMTRRAVAFAGLELARRAGVAGDAQDGNGFGALGLQLHYGLPQPGVEGRPTITVVPCQPRAWSDLREGRPRQLAWLPWTAVLPPGSELPAEGRIPVLFWGQGCESGNKPFAERSADDSIVFYVDILAATLFMLSRWEEVGDHPSDRHQRFPATASLAYQQGFLDRPLVDEYALIFQAWLRAILPGWQPRTSSFRVFLTHDIDRPVHRRPWKALARVAAGDLLKRHAPLTAMRTLSSRILLRNDECYAGFAKLMELSEQYGLESTFFFMAAASGPYHHGYDPRSRPYRQMIQRAVARHHQVGFHAGYDAVEDFERFRAQRDRLAEVVGRTDMGGRQHYLRFRVPATWRLWERAGMRYDSSLGYADCEGFRCGTCHPFRPFDLEQDRTLELWERPLIAMDSTLEVYRRLAPAHALQRILLLAQRCKAVAGEFVLLWHNQPSQGGWHSEWHPAASLYRSVIAGLAELQGRSEQGASGPAPWSSPA
jgi:hypothetical protein